MAAHRVPARLLLAGHPALRFADSPGPEVRAEAGDELGDDHRDSRDPERAVPDLGDVHRTVLLAETENFGAARLVFAGSRHVAAGGDWLHAADPGAASQATAGGGGRRGAADGVW